jgi:chemotaxis protein MotB
MSEESENIVVQEGAPDWVVTFGDLMSLLLCFFVLLLSFSEMDKAKYKQVAGSLAKAFGVQYQTKTMTPPKGISMVAKDFDQELIPTHRKEEFVEMQRIQRENVELQRRKDVGERLKEEIESSLQAMDGMEKLISVEVGENEVSIRLMGESTFDSGKAYIRPQMRPLLKKIAAVLREQEGEITVVGHTDNVPIWEGIYKSNLGLSMARAASVADYLLHQGLLEPERVATMGFGEYRPFETNNTPEGRQKNRRVEIKLKSPPIE